MYEVNQVVRLLVPYSGIGSGDFNIAIVTELVTDRMISVAPVAATYTCGGRVATWHTYYNRYVDFSTREVKPRVLPRIRRR